MKKYQYLFFWVSRAVLTVLIVGVLQNQSFAKPGSGGSSGAGSGAGHIYIPVRLNAFGGYQTSTNSIGTDYKNYAISAPTVGGDFSIPIPPIYSVVGITGWAALTNNQASASAEADNFFLLAFYLGYSDGVTDILVGTGVGTLQKRLRHENASPNREIDLSAAMGCGFGGLRHYFGTGVSLGIGVNAYVCEASTYNSGTTNSTGVLTNVIVDNKAMSYGGMAYLFLSWGEQRMLR